LSFVLPKKKTKKKEEAITRKKGLYEQLINIFISTVKSELIYVFGIPDLPAITMKVDQV